jgi:hypothetical protein
MDIATIAAPLERKVGPLPVWAYAAVLGAVFLVYRMSAKSGAATPATGGTGVNGSATAADPTAGGSAGGSSGAQPVTTLQPGQTAYDPNTAVTSTAPAVSLTDLLGGNLAQFAHNLGPNYQSFDLSAGGETIGLTNSADNIQQTQRTLGEYAANASNTAAQYAAQTQQQQNLLGYSNAQTSAYYGAANTQQLQSYQYNAYLAAIRNGTTPFPITG